MFFQLCHNCNEQFGAMRSSAKWCSPSCKSKAYRSRKAQGKRRPLPVIAKTDTRYVCKHCFNGFWGKGKGRKPEFCGASCRQMANLIKKSAAYKWCKHEGRMSDHDAWTYVELIGTVGMDRIAKAEGFEYSYSLRRYWSRKENLKFW